MMNKTLQRSLVVAAVVGACATAHGAPTWITVGDRALALLQQAAPAARTLASAQVAVAAPAARRSAALQQAVEGVHAVEVDDEALPALSEAVHESLRRCGGFVQHASAAEALAVLHRLQAPDAASAAPADAPSYLIDNPAQVNARLPQMQASNILATIQSMSDFQNRRWNSSHGIAASTWLYNRWSQLNPGNRRDVKVYQISHPGLAQKSVAFDIAGTTNANETIILGAHLDSITGGNAETGRAPGADDDASGVASLTEVIRVMMATQYRPARNIRIIGYAAEEAGLLGSRDVVAKQNGRRDKVVGVLQLDMTAYRGDATDIWLYTDYTNAAQNAFLASLVTAYLPTLTVGYDRCGYGCSDHASWHNAGYVVSYPFEASDAHTNAALHTANDTIATFGNQADHALKFARLSMAYAVELGSDGPALKAAAPTASTTAKAAMR